MRDCRRLSRRSFPDGKRQRIAQASKLCAFVARACVSNDDASGGGYRVLKRARALENFLLFCYRNPKYLNCVKNYVFKYKKLKRYSLLILLLPTTTLHGGFPAQSQLDFLQQIAVFQRRGDALFILELFVHLRLARVRAFGDFYLFLRTRGRAR